MPHSTAFMTGQPIHPQYAMQPQIFPHLAYQSRGRAEIAPQVFATAHQNDYYQAPPSNLQQTYGRDAIKSAELKNPYEQSYNSVELKNPYEKSDNQDSQWPYKVPEKSTDDGDKEF